MCYSIYLNQRINFLHFVDVQNEQKREPKQIIKTPKNVKN